MVLLVVMVRLGDAEPRQESLDARVARLASTQFGAARRAQALSLGVTRDMIRHRIRAGRWEPRTRHAFVIAGSPPSWSLELMVACLTSGGQAVVSHRAAAALLRLEGCVSDVVEITVPRTFDRAIPAAITHRNALLPIDVARVAPFRVTTVARTLIDLAAVAPRTIVEEALDDALRRKLVRLGRLQHRIDGLARSGRPGIVTIRELVAARDGSTQVTQSSFETRLLRLLRAARVPEPQLQFPVRRRGRVVARVDFAFPAARVAVEADGYRWHSGRAHWDRDRARRNDLTLLGWRVIHVTWTDLRRRPDATITAITRALAQ